MPTSFITAFRLPLYVTIYILLSFNLLWLLEILYRIIYIQSLIIKKTNIMLIIWFLGGVAVAGLLILFISFLADLLDFIWGVFGGGW